MLPASSTLHRHDADSTAEVAAALVAFTKPRSSSVRTSFPVEMNPLVGGSGVRSNVLAAARRPVTRYAADGRVVCQLCTELPSMENGSVTLFDQVDGTKGMTVTFTLRPGLRWGDGTLLKTKDILLIHAA